MNVAQPISPQGLASVIGQLIGAGYPDPENPQPPGPWDPIIKAAYQRVARAWGPLPDPWQLVALNPQPLPPGVAFAWAIGDEFVARASLMQETLDLLPEQQGGRIQSYIARFVDELCPRPYKIKIPKPRPPWLHDALTGLDLLVIGARLQQGAFETPPGALRSALAGAGEAFSSAGLAQLG